MDNDKANGIIFLRNLSNTIAACSGFTQDSSYYVGEIAFDNAKKVFKSLNFLLSEEGQIIPVFIDSLLGSERVEAYKTYIQRAHTGPEYAGLVTSAGKDLLEATAAHVLEKKWSNNDPTSNFPTLLG